MPFNSPLFVFLFAPIFFALYLLAKPAWKNLACLIGSLLFYAWAEPVFAVVVAASAAVDHWAARVIAASPSARLRKAAMTLALVQGVSILLYFKYAAFFYHTAASILGLGAASRGWLGPALPLAISFVIFEKVTYVVDVYRGVGRPARRFSDYLTYVFLFPKLVAGPIVKYHDIEAALTERRIAPGDFGMGLLRFGAGLAKKTLIADALAPYADAAFSAPATALTASNAWLGLIAFTFQIYFDFSAYSDMAIGLSRMMGFRLMENFDQPYLAVGFGAFWRRWHISLSTWIRDYLFIPLGGSRRGALATYRNLVVCFLISGLWHGANWTFVVWGLYHGLFIVADRLGLWALIRRGGTLLGIASTFLCVMLGWVLFRAPDIGHALGYFTALASPGRDAPPVVFLDQNLIVTLSVAAVLSFTPWRRAKAMIGDGWVGTALSQPAAWLIVGGFGWGCARMLAVAFNPFLYFRF